MNDIEGSQMQVIVEVGTVDDVLIVDAQIPEFDGRTSREKIESRLGERASLILIAKAGGKPIAYKMGYALSTSVFYSWLGGVIPDYRKQGIATQLREQQESWALDAGYLEISVKSMNRYPAMLQLLIASGYQISAYQDNGSSALAKICFTKRFDQG